MNYALAVGLLSVSLGAASVMMRADPFPAVLPARCERAEASSPMSPIARPVGAVFAGWRAAALAMVGSDPAGDDDAASDDDSDDGGDSPLLLGDYRPCFPWLIRAMTWRRAAGARAS
jgi:hypothetical protein